MKNFIKLAIAATFLAVATSSVARCDELTATKTEAKTEAPATKTEAKTTVRQGLKFVGVSAEDIHRASVELEDVLDLQIANEAKLKEKVPHLLKVEEEISRLEGGNALRQEVGAALKRGIVARASGVDEAELRLGTPRSAKDLLRHTAAEQELDELLNPTMWDKLKWWWNG